MDKKTKIILTLIALAAACVIGFLLYTMRQQTIESKQMLELAEMDKLEMENEYEQFAMQYNEMKTQINNDSLVAQLEMEQKRTEELLEELRRVKSSDAAEIMRLKKELATLREVLRSYVLQIDSLNRMNEALTQENSNLKTQNEQARQHISNLSTENESLSDKVAIASQLDATGIYAVGHLLLPVMSRPRQASEAFISASRHPRAMSSPKAEPSPTRTVSSSTASARISNTQARNKA